MENKLKIVYSKNKLMRIDVFLKNNLKTISRSAIVKMIKNGLIIVNNKNIKQNYLLKTNDVIIINYANLKNNNINKINLKPWNVNLDIVYEDNEYIIVNKPNNIIVHSGINTSNQTLVNGMVHYFKQKQLPIFNYRCGLINRLDKQTTGLIIFSKYEKAYNLLKDELQQHNIQKLYLAITKYNSKYNINDILEINLPIARNKKNITKQVIKFDYGNSKQSISKIKIIKKLKRNFLVECLLITGRTHQLRVQLNYVHLDILNDPKYSQFCFNKNFGQYLHSWKLNFINPITKKKIKCQAELPSEFQKIINYNYDKQ